MGQNENLKFCEKDLLKGESGNFVKLSRDRVSMISNPGPLAP
jgi:hypothetical protein